MEMKGLALYVACHKFRHIPYKQKYWQTLIIFGGSLKQCCWWDFNLADFSTVWRETHACSINGSMMAQVNLAISMCSPNRQIKITVNISAYTV